MCHHWRLCQGGLAYMYWMTEGWIDSAACTFHCFILFNCFWKIQLGFFTWKNRWRVPFHCPVSAQLWTKTSRFLNDSTTMKLLPTRYTAKRIQSPTQILELRQSLPWPQVYNIKHLGMHTASVNIRERMELSQELSKFQRGAVIGCRLCNKSSYDIFSLLYSTITVSGIGNDSNSATK